MADADAIKETVAKITARQIEANREFIELLATCKIKEAKPGLPDVASVRTVCSSIASFITNSQNAI